MKSFTRYAAMSFSAAAFFAGMGVAQASDWFSLNLFGSDPATTQTTTLITPDQQQPAPDAPAIQLAANKTRFKDGAFQGSSYDAYYGRVQVQANVQGGQIVSVDVLDYPNHRSTSRAINRQALPMLQNEVIQAQGVRVNIISGATLTSRAYLRSLNSALKQALN